MFYFANILTLAEFSGFSGFARPSISNSSDNFQKIPVKKSDSATRFTDVVQKREKQFTYYFLIFEIWSIVT